MSFFGDIVSDFQAQIRLKQKSNIKLKEPMTIEELLALMTERWDTQKHGNFKLEKFLFFKSIRLDDYLVMRFDVQIASIVGQGKNLMVHIGTTRIKNLNKTQRQQVEAMGGYMATRDPVLKYFEGLCDAMRDVLGDRVAE